MKQETFDKMKSLVANAATQMSEGQKKEIVNALHQAHGDPVVDRDTSFMKSKALDELNNLTGCHEAKRKIVEMVCSHRYANIVGARTHIEQIRHHYHAMFTGNTGTAKTTCARLYARILAEQKIIRSDRYVELTRSQICGAYVGHTAKNVKRLFESYKGGLMLIDEAYALTEEEDHDIYGLEAINEMIVWLENNPDTVVIFAGYEGKMQSFIDSNPGLLSRVPYHVHFPDYTTDELLEITTRIAQGRGFTIADGAQVLLRQHFDSLRKVENFGNGRCCRNIVEQSIQKKAFNMGVMDTDDLSPYYDPAKYSDEDLLTLDEKCFELEAGKTSKTGHRLGFE